MKKRISIFTPTYNRGYIIEKTYQSLRNQTCRDFEWIVVDDGSSDNTEELFSKWISEENDFDIRYTKVENGGKHRAINLGVNMSESDLFFIVDSDDFLLPKAVEKVLEVIDSLPSDEKFAGVGGSRGYSENRLIGTTFQGDILDCTSLERKKHNINGDKAEVFFTEVLRKYPFPEFDGEKFLTEACVWFKIAKDGYKLRWFNEITYITEYLEDGLTASVRLLHKKSPQGTLYFYKLLVESGYISKLKACVAYASIGRYNKYSIANMARDLGVSYGVMFVAYLISLVFRR